MYYFKKQNFRFAFIRDLYDCKPFFKFYNRKYNFPIVEKKKLHRFQSKKRKRTEMKLFYFVTALFIKKIQTLVK